MSDILQSEISKYFIFSNDLNLFKILSIAVNDTEHLTNLHLIVTYGIIF